MSATRTKGFLKTTMLSFKYSIFYVRRGTHIHWEHFFFEDDAV
jgi:hypothetical protein